ncbi:MAG: hypothetical protein LBT57_02570 [Puniceicoccales bacterium]|jgi:hypothetical protein|nr:hypothetical protein [Puniceicoccales bacterium]
MEDIGDLEARDLESAWGRREGHGNTGTEEDRFITEARRDSGTMVRKNNLRKHRRVLEFQDKQEISTFPKGTEGQDFITEGLRCA